jgi:hypothetical protein
MTMTLASDYFTQTLRIGEALAGIADSGSFEVGEEVA